MPNLLASVISDAHANSRERKEDAFFALDQFFDYTLEHDPPWCLLLGDMLDEQRNLPEPINFYHRWFDRLERKEIGVGAIQGQHEACDEETWLGGHHWVQHLHRQMILVGDYHVYGLDFTPADKLQAELADIPNHADILLAHQVWADFMGDIAKPQGSFADVPHVKFLFTGDYHKTVIQGFVGKDGQLIKVVSPGSTHMRAINEPPDKYFITFWDNGAVKKVKLKSRPVMNWSPMATSEELEAFLAEFDKTLEATLAENPDLPESLQKPMLRITYASRLEDAPRRIKRKVDGRALLYWDEVPSQERQDARKAAVQAVKTGGGLTPAAVLPTLVNPKKKPEVYALLTRLLDAGEKSHDVDAELARFMAEFMSAAEKKEEVAA